VIGARKHGAAVRAFFAVEPGAGVRAACAEVAERLRRAPHGDGVRWVRPEGYHVTLRFLGNVPTEQVPALARAVGEAVEAVAPFELAPGGARVLPSPRRPRVVVLELAPEAPLAALAGRVEQAVVAAGLPPERRAFRAHLTLGRVRGRRVPDVAGAAASASALPVEEVVLFRSDLGREGSRYTALERLPLRGGPRRRGRGPRPVRPPPENPVRNGKRFHAFHWKETQDMAKGERSARAEGGDARKKAIEMAVSTIEKQFGKGSILTMTEDSIDREVEAFSSGSVSLDLALGIGGFPRGRVVEIYGPESSGKTTLTLHAVAEVQKAGGVAAFIDAEHALDVNYARRLGVKVEDLLVSQPDTGEQALEIADVLLRSGAVDLVVIDSVAALVPRAEIEGEMGDTHVGLQARLMSQALRKITGTVSKSHATVMFINQIRMKIGVMFGNPETTTGGNALKFYSSVRLDVRRIAAIKDGDEVVGNRTRVKVVKNKVAPPFRQAEFDILYNEGVSFEGDLLDLGADTGVVEKSGSWYSYDGERIGQGRENARRFLRENPDVRERVADAVYAAKGLKRRVPAHAEAKAPEAEAKADAGS
jgi:recombination protein RecA